MMNKKNIVLFFGGIIFGFGLAYGGMSKPEIVLSFLRLDDLGLIILMISAIIPTAISINIIPKLIEKPILLGEFKLRQRTLTKKTIIGATIFGIGWGISGQCPGSAISSIGLGNYPILAGIASIFIGAYIMGRYFAN
jgi:hypothetical protein